MYLGCNEGRDSVWRILWPATAHNTPARQKCPGGVESLGTFNLCVDHEYTYAFTGFATRYCDANRNWDDSTLDVSQCQSVEVLNIINEVQALTNNASFAKLVDITSRLNDVLNSSTDPILPMDLQSSNEILSTVLRYE